MSRTPTTNTNGWTRRLEGTVAVVTGASSGIGAATAHLLASLGSSVVLAARRGELLAEVVSAITAEGGTAIAQVADTTSADDLQAVVDRAVTEFGHLDFAVNSAGTPGRAPFLDMSMDQFDNVMNVNVRGVVLAMRAEIPAMVTNGSGAIVNVASVGGLVGVPGLSAYVTSKHAVVGLTKSVGLEYATKGIRINAIAPGGTNTEMLASGTKEQRDFLASLAPMQRISEPIEIATSIVYLLAYATYSVGLTLAADGGQSVA